MSVDKPDPLDELLRQLHHVETPSGQELGDIRRRLQEPAGAPAPRPPAALMRPTLVAALTLVAIAVGVLLTGSNPATAVFHELAQASRTDPVVIRANEFSYVQIDSTRLVAAEVEGFEGGLLYLLPMEEERWTSAEGYARMDAAVGRPRFFDRASEEAYYEAGLDEADGVGRTDSITLSGVEGPITYFDWPTEPAALEEFIRSMPPITEDVLVAEEILDLVRATAASSQLRAAAFEVLSNLDIELVDSSAGLHRFMMLNDTEDPAYTLEFAFDDEAHLIAERQVLTERHPVVDLEAGTVLWDAKFEGHAVVALLGERP